MRERQTKREREKNVLVSSSWHRKHRDERLDVEMLATNDLKKSLKQDSRQTQHCANQNPFSENKNKKSDDIYRSRIVKVHDLPDACYVIALCVLCIDTHR